MKALAFSFLRQAREIFPVAVFCVYSWALLVFLWDLPAFFFYLSAWDILGYLSYQLAFALGESALAALVAAALPRVFLKKGEPLAAGALLLLSFAVSALVFKWMGNIAQGLARTLPISNFAAAQAALGVWAFSALALPLLSFRAARSPKTARLTRNFIESLKVLSGLYVILSLLGAAIVLYRNL